MLKRKTRCIYVGNLNFQTSEADLEKLFSEVGTIEQITIPRHDDGRNKGFAYVTFSSPEEADAALRKDESTVDGKIIAVEFYRRPRPRFFQSRFRADPPDKPDRHHRHRHHHHRHHRRSDSDSSPSEKRHHHRHHHHSKSDKHHRHHSKSGARSSDAAPQPGAALSKY